MTKFPLSAERVRALTVACVPSTSALPSGKPGDAQYQREYYRKNKAKVCAWKKKYFASLKTKAQAYDALAEKHAALEAEHAALLARLNQRKIS